MKKGLLTGLFIIFLGVVGYIVYNYIFPEVEKTSKVIDAIPIDAALIIHGNSINSQWSSSITSHPSWNSLKLIPAFQFLNDKINALDSLSQLDQGLASIIQKSDFYTSVVMTGPGNFDLLLTIELTGENRSQFEKFSKMHLVNLKKVSRTYNESQITDLFLDDGKRLSFSIENQILILSETPTLVEKSLLQLKSNNNLSNDHSFSKLYKTTDKTALINLFINYKELSSVIDVYLKKNNPFKTNFSTLGNWSELDLRVKDHGIILTGLSIGTDSIGNYFHAFKEQKQQSFTTDKILPKNTSFFIQNSASDLNQYFKNYSTVLDKHQKLISFDNRFTKLEAKYGEKNLKSLKETIGLEWVYFITEPQNDQFELNTSLAYQLRNIETDQDNFISIVSEFTQDSLFTEEFQDYQIREIFDASVFNSIFGTYINLNKKAYYCFLEDYVVISNEVGNLKHIINSYSKGLTLSKSSNYQTFLENFPSKGNLFCYYNLLHGQEVLGANLHSSFHPTYNSYKDSIQTWESFGFMLIGGEELMYSNAYIKYNPKIEDHTMSLFSQKLEAPLATKPSIVINHKTKKEEIIVQDEKNNLYLLTADGKKLWSLPIGEKIISKIHQVDRYKNNKIQYLFNTKSTIYLVDRNGRFVEDFPLTLSSNATNGISVIDYDKSRKYRILLANEKKEILCFDIRGKEVQGWLKPKTKHILKSEINLITKNKKDYLTLCDSKGSIKILNRKGEDRIKLKSTLPADKNYFLNVSENIETSSFVCTDSLGTIYELNFSDIKEATPLKAFSTEHKFYFIDIDGDNYKDYIFSDEGIVTAYKLTKSKIFEYENHDITHFSNISVLGKGNNTCLGITDEANGMTYLINKSGELIEGFPIDGNSPMTVHDLPSSDKMELIISDNEGNIYFYSFSL